MKRTFLLAAIAIALAAPLRMAHAGPCELVCASAKRTCQLAEVTAFRVCRMDARRSAGRHRDAFRSCRDALHAGQVDCAAAMRECANTCSPPPPAGSCEGDCADAAQTCFQGVVADGRTCAQGCTGPGRLGCLAGCLGDAHSGLVDCRTTLASCRQGCSTPPPDSCSASCVADGRSCGQQAVSDFKDCLDSCVGAPGRLQCAADCASQARSDLGDCKDSLDSCLSDCGGSPSGAFIAAR